jgi:hypothetical protein
MELPPAGPKVPGAIIIFLASNCHSFSRRECFVRELMRFLPVHSYGKCLNNRDSLIVEGVKMKIPDDGPNFIYRDLPGVSALEKFIGYYKFYLAYENSICDLYRTEKLFRAFRAGTVPVVSGVIESAYLPYQDSVISVDSFSTVRALANYLLWLDSNNSEYSRFLQWRELASEQLRSEYVGLEISRCNLCSNLHRTDWHLKPGSLENVQKWWNRPGTCRTPIIQLNQTCRA